MDDTAQFVLIAKRILRELRGLSESVSAGFLGIQKQIESIAEQQQPKEEHQQSPPILRAELQIPQSIKSDWESENTKKARREYFAIGVSVLTLFAVAAYAIINYRMLCQISREADAATRSADVAKGQLVLAQRSLGTTIDSFHLEQRAWLGLGEALPPPFMEGRKRVYVKEGEETSFGFIITNSGRTPAMNVIQGTSYISLLASAKFSPRYPGGTERAGVFQPNAKVWAITPTTGRWTKLQVDNLKNGVYALYLFGTISYDDVFGATHHTTICMELSKDLTGFFTCATYNKAD